MLYLLRKLESFNQGGKNIQKGFGGMQLLMVGAIIGVASLVAVPKYNAFVDQAKLTEAFTFAGESKRKLSEFYMTNNRFPKTSVEARPMVTESLSPPKFVDSVVVWPNHMEPDSIDLNLLDRVHKRYPL